MAIKNSFPQNLTTLALFFHKNPLHESRSIFVKQSGENSLKTKHHIFIRLPMPI
jgi:hypothetical protein